MPHSPSRLGFRFLMVVSLVVTSSLSLWAEEPLPREPQFQINEETTGNQLLPRIAALPGPIPGAGFLVVWHDGTSSGTSSGDDDSGTSIQGRWLDATGRALGGELQINQATAGDQRGAAVAFDALGRGLVVWESESSEGDDSAGWSIQGRILDPAAGPMGDDFQINSGTTGDQRQPEVAALPGGGFVVVWRGDSSTGDDAAGSSIQGRRFEPSGQAIGGDFQINTYTSGDQSRPSLTALPDDGFVVAWESYGSPDSDNSSWSVLARRFATDGSPAAGSFQVNEFTTSQQRDPALASSPDGEVLVTWQSSTSGESDLDWGIHGRLFDTADQPLGPQFQVNTTTESDQYYSAVQHDGRGFLVVWKSFGSAGGDPDLSIQARRYAADGSALGGELQVNDHVDGDQKLPRIAKTARGPVMAVWESETSPGTDSDGWSVQGRILDLPIFRDGFESGDTSRWTNASPGLDHP